MTVHSSSLRFRWPGCCARPVGALALAILSGCGADPGVLHGSWVLVVRGSSVAGIASAPENGGALAVSPAPDVVGECFSSQTPPERPIDTSPPPPGVRAQFVQRENRDGIARWAAEVSQLPASHGRSARLVIVGHSHAPCVAFSNVPRPTVIVDAGSWAFDQANLLLAANDTVGVFHVLPR